MKASRLRSHVKSLEFDPSAFENLEDLDKVDWEIMKGNYWADTDEDSFCLKTWD